MLEIYRIGNLNSIHEDYLFLLDKDNAVLALVFESSLHYIQCDLSNEKKLCEYIKENFYYITSIDLQKEIETIKVNVNKMLNLTTFLLSLNKNDSSITISEGETEYNQKNELLSYDLFSILSDCVVEIERRVQDIISSKR